MDLHLGRARGSDIAVVVNVKARRGSERVARRCQAALPNARVVASHSLDQTADFAEELQRSPAGLVVSAGGDGTAVALINAIREATRSQMDDTAAGPNGDGSVLMLPEQPGAAALGVLPLGTGNGWARATGAPRLPQALARLGELEGSDALPVRRCDLVEVLGTIAPFAGTGWDAELIDDYHAQRQGWGLLPRRLRLGLPGYLHGLATRTVPRHVVKRDQVEVELVNTGDDAFTVDEGGRAIALVGGRHGAVLYRGPVNVCAAGTSPTWGFGFRAFPFAGLMPRRFCMRVYAGTVMEAVLRSPLLWQGRHPMRDMHTFLLTSCQARFSRPVPFQVGGDRAGFQSVVDYDLAKEQVNLLEWSRLAA